MLSKKSKNIEIPSELILFATLSEKLSLKVSEITPESESAAYNAFDLKLNSFKIKFRISKITPTKNGQFVTIYKRIENGTIAPFEKTDDIDLVIISSKKEKNQGYFIFPKSELIKRGIFTDKKEGKRAFRVYPSWDIANNNQAQKTQKWQLEYFIKTDDEVDPDRIKKLLSQ